MAFDTQGALNAGYTQEEINNYLRGQQKLTKAENIPVIGKNIISPISKVIRGSVAGATLATTGQDVAKNTQRQQKIAYDLIKMAQKETDPVRKKRFLDESKRISSGATRTLDEALNPMLQAMPEDYQNKNTPQGNVATEIIGTMGKLGIINPSVAKFYGTDTYANDAIAAGNAAGEAYAIPSTIKTIGKAAVGTGKGIVNYGKTIVEGEGIKGKLSRIIPTNNISAQQAEKATKAATAATERFSVSKQLKEIIDVAKNAPVESKELYRQKAAKMVSGTLNVSPKTRIFISKMNLDDLAKIAEKADDISMLQALSQRRELSRTMGGLFKSMFSPTSSEIKKQVYKTYNTQLQKIAGVKSADKIISTMKDLNKLGIGWGVIKTVLGGNANNTVEKISSIAGN